ncbi:MAG: TIGR03560 family F420-dependent LLM class oxidoreductase [Chloroflexi bacterium]|nr:TIGR03560 family F420-dependent LLM class oxidoreductase [Chloroflexota bacterium]
MSVKFGTFVPQGWRMDLVEIDDPLEQYNAMTQVGKAAEQAGYDSIWVFDHFHTVPTPEIETTFEAWTITAGLSRDTSSIRIGQMVTCNGYRNPAYLAKVASTVDVLSRGRLICGLGAGWYEHEWRAYGYGFPDIPARMGAFRESVEIVVKMWTEEKATFKGKFYSIDGAINEPKGVQKPHIPLWLGGGGEKVTLKLVAQWGNGCNVGGGKIDIVRQKLDVLRQHCANVGRNFDEITRSTSMNIFLLEDGADPVQATAKARGAASYETFARDNFVGTSAQISEQISQLSELGINYVITSFPRVAYDHTMLHRFASEVMPAFA